MVQINLLPWRKLQREKEIRKLLSNAILSAFASLCFVLVAKLYCSFLINNQMVHNQLLQQEINSLNKQFKDSQLLKHRCEQLGHSMDWIKKLLITRSALIHLLDELRKIMPDNLYLITLEKEEDKVTLWGCSSSNKLISILMRRIEQNSWMENPILKEIKSMEEGYSEANNQFKLSFTLKYLT